MAEDVVPGLLSDIAADYAAAAEREPMRRTVAEKIQRGTARLSDVHNYAEGTGRALSSALTGNLTPEKLPDGTLYYNIADRTITPMARQSCEEINRVAAEILAQQDARDGVNLKAVPAEFPTERVEGLVDKAADAGEDFPGWLDEPIVNLCEHVADSFMKANADFRYKSGMSPRIRRDSYARCCDWCADLDGVYDYKDAPREVYARHEFCRCVVTFENGRERQNVWTKERWTADRDELDRRREYGLTDSLQYKRKPDFYTGPNKKTIEAKYVDWIGTNMRDQYLAIASNPILKNAISELYRPGSFIGDGGSAAILRFEDATGLKTGRTSTHLQKCKDMLSYLQNKVSSQNLTSKEQQLTDALIQDLKDALNGR